MAIITRNETRCDGFGCKDHDKCVAKYKERDRLLDLFDELYDKERKQGLMIVSNDMKVHFAQQHELIENTLTGTDVQIIKFHNELLRSITELYAIPPERLRKVIQENNLKDTKARKIIKVKRAHTLYKALNDSLDYIKNKYFKE